MKPNMYFASLFLLTLNFITIVCEINPVQSFSMDYFTVKNVKFVCVIMCQESSLWSNRFAKEASLKSIAIAKMNYSSAKRGFDMIEKCLYPKNVNIGILIEADCPNFEEIMIFASVNMWLDDMHKWLVLSKVINETVLLNGDITETFKEETHDSIPHVNTFDNLNISVDADITMSIQKGLSSFELYEIYNFGKVQGGNLIIKTLGSWSNETGLKTCSSGYKYYNRWDFQQWSMRSVTAISKPIKVFDSDTIVNYEKQTPGVAVLTKTSSAILNVIAEIHNFRYNYTVTDRWVGSYEPNSTRVASNYLYFREQDITSALRLNLNSYDKIDPVMPAVTSVETKYYYRIPTSGVGKYENEFLTPLSKGSWGCFLAVITLCAAVLLASAMLEQRPTPTQYGVFSAIASVCQQFFEDMDVNATRRVSSARKMALLVTGFFCILIYNYYTSSVVSWLLNGPPPSINSLKELLDSPLELIYEDIGYSRSWVQIPSYYFNKRNAKIEDEMRKKKVFTKKKGDPLYKTVERGIAMVKAGDAQFGVRPDLSTDSAIISLKGTVEYYTRQNTSYAFHTDPSNANELISKTFTLSELCELGYLQSMEKTYVYSCLQKHSPYTEFFNWSLKRLQERGIMSRIQRRTGVLKISCDMITPRSLSLGGAAPVFLLLLAGYVISLFIMLLERISSGKIELQQSNQISIRGK